MSNANSTTQTCNLCNNPLHIHDTLSLGKTQLAECVNIDCAAYMITLTLEHLTTLNAEIAATYKAGETVVVSKYAPRADNPYNGRTFG